jgi:hypothetical protein
LKDATWFLLISVIGIPVGGWIVTHLSARISRTTSHETALLAAAQRRRDAEISQLRDAQNDLLEAATAVQSFVWYVDKDTRLRTAISPEEWYENREFFERAAVAAQRLRAIALAMPTDELHDKYIEVERLMMAVLRGSGEENPKDAWHEDLQVQPDTITRAVRATGEEIKRLYNTYPAKIPSPELRSSQPGWYFDHILLAGRRYWDGSRWTEHTAP